MATQIFSVLLSLVPDRSKRFGWRRLRRVRVFVLPAVTAPKYFFRIACQLSFAGWFSRSTWEVNRAGIMPRDSLPMISTASLTSSFAASASASPMSVELSSSSWSQAWSSRLPAASAAVMAACARASEGLDAPARDPSAGALPLLSLWLLSLALTFSL